MRKPTWKERLQYYFDNVMSKGTAALVGILFLVTLIVVVVAGVLATFVSDSSVGNNVWMSLMHAIDAGTLSGDETGNISIIILMSIVTVCGIFITSILIGIITTGFEEKLTNLRRGHSKVLESDHTVILGFNDQVYTMISQLIVANEMLKDACIVIVGDMDKEEMDRLISHQNIDWKSTRIICRSGNITENHTLEMCSIDTCRSVIINETNDFVVIKSILSIVNYMKTTGIYEKKSHIVSTISDELNYSAAQIAGEGKLELIYTKDAISRIIAHTCRQPGLSSVLLEIFDYNGDELYFETYTELIGQKFKDCLQYFEKGVLFGIERNGQVLLNPLGDTILQQGDQCIVMEEDKGAVRPSKSDVHPVTAAIATGHKTTSKIGQEPEHILILGVNEKLSGILQELDFYVASGTSITIANEIKPEVEIDYAAQYRNVQIGVDVCNTDDRRSLDRLVSKEIDHVLILSDQACEVEFSDAKTLVKLIHLRDIAQKTGHRFSITSEMQNAANQSLAQITKVNDFVVGTNIINLILTQISQNRELNCLFKELLSEEGSEIYMKKAKNYVPAGQAVNFYTITRIAADYGQVAVGYKKILEDGTFEIITNPFKSKEISFGEKDDIIVLARE